MRSPRFAGRARRVVEHLKENFVLAYHAELAAGTFFDCFETLLEVTHFGIESRIAHLQARVDFLLCDDLAINLPYAQPAAFSEPERVLQQHDQRGESESEQPHLATREA